MYIIIGYVNNNNRYIYITCQAIIQLQKKIRIIVYIKNWIINYLCYQYKNKKYLRVD